MLPKLAVLFSSADASAKAGTMSLVMNLWLSWPNVSAANSLTDLAPPPTSHSTRRVTVAQTGNAGKTIKCTCCNYIMQLK